MRLVRPDLPVELDAVVLRALARDLDARFGSLEELGRALLPFAAAGSVPQTSWHGAWGAGTVSFHGPTVGSIHGSVPRPPSTLASVTADGTVAKKRHRGVMGAAALLAVLFALALFVWPEAADRVVADRPVVDAPEAPAQPSAPTARAGVTYEDPSAVPARLTPAQASAGELTVAPGAEAPAATPVEAAADEPQKAAVEEREPRRARRVGALSARRDVASTQGAKAASLRSRQESGAAALRKASESLLIPGTRTNGLSPDDF